jgi:plastocyanin
MRRLLTAALAVLVLAGLSTASAATVNVAITRAGLVPKDITIKQGDTVTWTNSDSVSHQIVVKNYACNLTIQPGQQGSCTFTTPGKFSYSDPNQRGNAFKGSITVQAGPASVSLQSSKKLVVYGGTPTLSGRVSTGQANERVTIHAQACGQTSFAQIAALSTTTGGAFSTAVKPLLNTTYQAKWRSTTSPNVVVKVRPRIKLAKLAPRKFSVRVSATSSFAGRYIVFQRYSPALVRWVNVRRVYLRATTLGVSPTVVSARSFRVTIKARLRIRGFMPQGQAGVCYAGGPGAVIRS